MKIEKINKEYHIFVDKYYINDVNYSDKKSITDFYELFNILPNGDRWSYQITL